MSKIVNSKGDMYCNINRCICVHKLAWFSHAGSHIVNSELNPEGVTRRGELKHFKMQGTLN